MHQFVRFMYFFSVDCESAKYPSNPQLMQYRGLVSSTEAEKQRIDAGLIDIAALRLWA